MSELQTFNDSLIGEKNVAIEFSDYLSSSGDFKRLQGINVQVNSIRNLLLTPLGTYIFDPTYGSLLYQKVFEPHDEITLEEINFEVTTRIKNFDKSIDVSKVQIFNHTDGKGYRISIELTKEEDSVPLDIDLRQDTSFGLEDIS
jgi:phage baseplate assembly protein W|tara:strand:- start:9 stop:440 length:432 start_codon:yes stop_codon:yes gene_type:complete